MSQRTFLLGSAFALLALAFIVTDRLVYPLAAAERKIKSIRAGMSRQGVEAILGRPPDGWFPWIHSTRSWCGFGPRPLRPGDEHAGWIGTWSDGRVVVTVLCNLQWRVADVYHQWVVHDSEPAFLRRLRALVCQ
jgi:hypothetical protein